jgi:hypothetical protein
MDSNCELCDFENVCHEMRTVHVDEYLKSCRQTEGEFMDTCITCDVSLCVN